MIEKNMFKLKDNHKKSEEDTFFSKLVEKLENKWVHCLQRKHRFTNLGHLFLSLCLKDAFSKQF